MARSQQVAGAGRIEVPRTAAEVAALEAAYRPFETAAAWSGLTVDATRWQRHRVALARAVAGADPRAWQDLRERFLGAAALDSTALAELIRPVPDLTAVVLRSAISEAAWSSLTSGGREVVDCHRRALGVAAEAAASGRAIDEALVGTLQDLIVESQETYTVTVEDGTTAEVAMPRRQYKPISNYLVRSDGQLMPFAPAGRVASETQRLVAELRSVAFRELHPVVRAAYIHVSLIRVHPFADGNGRLARTLASMPLLEEAGLPQLILSDQWPAYVDALARSDDGDIRPFVELFLAAQVNAMDLARGLLEHGRPDVVGSLPAASAESPLGLLLDLAEIHVRDLVGVPADGTQVAVTRGDGAAGVRVAIAADGELAVDLNLTVEVDEDERWLRLASSGGGVLEVWRDDVVPAPVEIVHLRVRSWLERLLRGHADGLPATTPVRGLFVLGVPRSGTTLIGNYIGSHPDVLGLAEYGAFYVTGAVAPAYIDRLPGRGHRGFLAVARAKALEHAVQLARQAGRHWFCDATPWNLQIAESLRDALPDAIFVLMLRHFSGAVLSLQQFDWAGKSVTRAAKLWVDLNRNVGQLPAERTLIVSYDVLAEDPASTITGIRDALDDIGLDPVELDDLQLVGSHAHLVGKPRPTIGHVVDGHVELGPIASLDEERWTPKVHERVWPIVRDMHQALTERFPGVYVSPPRPGHVLVDQW